MAVAQAAEISLEVEEQERLQHFQQASAGLFGRD